MNNYLESTLNEIFCVHDLNGDVTHSQRFLFVCFLINCLRVSVFDIMSQPLTGAAVCFQMNSLMASSVYSAWCVCVWETETAASADMTNAGISSIHALPYVSCNCAS